MKYNKIILPALAATMLLTGCDDMKMEWGTPEGHNAVTSAELPLAVKEVLANYGDIKEYAAQYTPQMTIGLGLGASKYVADSAYKSIADANFTMFTTGNAMKMDAIVGNSGTLSFTSLDAFLDAMPADRRLYGHNFIWHTQQQQTYLKSLIAPEMVINSDPSEGVVNVIDDPTFEVGKLSSNWGAWSSAGCTASISEKGEGYESDYAMVLNNPKAGANYSAQAYYKLPDGTIEEGKTYVIKAYFMSVEGDASFQCQMQERSGYTGDHYLGMELPAGKWVAYEKEFTATENDEKWTHVVIDFGAATGKLYVDNFYFGEKDNGPKNYVSNGSFEDGNTDTWTLAESQGSFSVVDLDDATAGSKVLKAVVGDGSSNYWDVQLTSDNLPALTGKKVELSFFIKSDQAGKARVSFNDQMSNRWPWMNWTGSQSSWTEAFETSTGWTKIDVVLQNFSTDFVEGATTWQFCIDLGAVAGVTYYIDDIKVVEYTEESTAANVKSRAMTRASGISYNLQTAEEKRTNLLNFMDTWIKGMADHLAEKGITPYAYDVINEPITDGDCKVRGVDGVFGGSVTDDDGNVTYDSEPTEDTESGLTLNWGSGHFYWGYYVSDFAVQAFTKARQYLPAETKLFVNDYNLETNPSKLAALIQFANDIDTAYGSTVVDGIGTQMHLSISATDDADENAAKIAEMKAKVDAMFQTMAATGKLVRVTELDVALGTSSPSSAAYEAQADIYKMVFESYKTNVPSDQQSGITIWGLSDAEDEHEYWLTGELPNLWDASYLRKWAYKGVCDGIAGEDLGLKYGGEDYKAYYEKNNVSETVK